LYIRQLVDLRTLLALRYKGRSLWEIFAALFPSLDIFEGASESGGNGESGDYEESKIG
jgi:hypothetical protein